MADAGQSLTAEHLKCATEYMGVKTPWNRGLAAVKVSRGSKTDVKA